MNHTTLAKHSLVHDRSSGSAGRNKFWSRMALMGCLVLAATGAAAQTAGTLTVRAWATLAANVGPQMEVRVNGALVGSTEVRATNYQNYTFPGVSVPAGAKLELVFNNDAFAGDGDRNLFVESITVNGTTIASDAPGVVFDRGPGPQAFDGVDVMPGLSTLYWNGALRFTLGSGGTTPPTTTTDTPPAGYSRCASEWETCSFTGSADVVYGALATWTSPRSFTGGTPCTNTVFGDPLRGTFKACYFKPTATTPTPLGLNLTIAGTGGVGFSDGSSCSASCAKTFNSGSTVTLVAAPAVGFTFAGWGGACAGTSSTCTVTMDAAKNVSATFSAVVVTRTLNLTIAGTGGVGFSDGSSCASSCSRTFNNGSVVTLAAAPSTGFTFTGWSGACSGTSPTCTVTMDAAKTVSATFAVSPATLSVAVTGSGTVNSTPSGINCTSNCSAPFAVGSNVTLTATPATGFTFSGWSGACTGTAACTVSLSASASVSAAFASASVAGSCPTTNTTVASAGGQQLGLNVSRNSGVAPLAVFFDASGTTATGTTRPFHDLEYRWGFGDTASGTWAYGAKAGTASRNEAMGPVAAHVFENAGTYPITVSAFNGTSTVTYNCNITVLPADVEFAGNKTICVSGVGNFAGCPAGALRVTNPNPTTAVANNIGTGNKRILFARGETFSAASSISINRPGPSLIGAFGSGAKPILSATSSNAIVSLSSASTPTGVSDWRFQDLALNGNLLASAFYGAGSASRVLLSRVDISNVGYGVLLGGSTLAGLNGAVPFTHAMWDEFYMVDSSIYNLIPGLGPNAMFANSYRMVVMGSSVDNNRGGEHGIRMQLANRAVFSHNTIQGIAPGKVNLTIRGGGFEGGNTIPPGQYSEKIVMSDNRLVGGDSVGMVGIGPQNAFNDERGRDMIFERNLLLASASVQNLMLVSQPDITIRNNLVNIPTTTRGGFAFGIAPNGNVPNPTRVNIYNNSVYYGGNASNAWSLLAVSINDNPNMPFDQTMPGSVFELRNNILYAPDRLDDWAVVHRNLPGVAAVTNQSNNTVNPSASPLFATNPPTTPAHFTPSLSSYANGAGIGVRVHSDFDGLATQSPPHIGAKRPAATAGTPPSTPLSFNLSVTGTGGVGFSDGSSCSASCAKTFNSGSTVTLVAAPAVGFTFAGWGGACAGTSSTCTVTMDAAKNVSATFSAVVVTRTLNLTIAGTGGVGFSDGSSCASSCSRTFNNGSVVTLAAAPSTGFTFTGWSGACSGTTTTCSVTMDAAKTVSATFAVSPATLSVAVTGSGTVNSTPSGINCTSNCSAPFAVGSNVTLTATPATGFTFSGWSGACTGTAACTVTLSASTSVSAAFASASVAGSCPTTNTTVASAGGQQLGLNVSRNSGVAPLAVFFDASGTTATSTARPFHELEYRWNFGDTASGTWAYGAKAGTASRNEAMGPVAAHVFENAGTYPITVSAFNGTSTVTYNCNITVLPADVEFAGNKTICVSGVGNFAGCPAGALRVTNPNPTTAVANNIGTGNKRILFARGETFNVGASISINQPGPGIIGAFGTGAKPTMVNSVAIGTFSLSSIYISPISDWRLMDLKIDGNGFGGNSVGVYAAGAINNALMSRLDIQNIHTGIKYSGSRWTDAQGFGLPMWDGVFVVDSSVYNLAGTGATGGNGIYTGGWRMALMGNHIDPNFGGEHGIRTSYSDRAVYQHNTIRGVSSGRAYLSVRSPNQEDVMPLRNPAPGTVNGITYTEKVVASDNHLIGSAATSGFAGTGPTNQGSSGRAREQIWERNLLVGGSGTSGYLGFTGYQITARNNIMIMPHGGQIMAVSSQPLDVSPNPTDIWIYNNSIYYSGTENFQMLVLVGGSMAGSNLSLQNNLFYTPNGASWGTQINNLAGATLTTCANCNTLDSEIKVNPNFAVNPPTTAAHFKPTSGSYAIGRGVSVPVWSDYFGVPIAPGARDLGAVKR